MTKQIIFVVIAAILVGSIIFWFTRKTPQEQTTLLNQPFPKLEVLTSPYPTPMPTPPAINESSNLEEELNKQTPRDFSEDFNSLRNSF